MFSRQEAIDFAFDNHLDCSVGGKRVNFVHLNGDRAMSYYGEPRLGREMEEFTLLQDRPDALTDGWFVGAKDDDGAWRWYLSAEESMPPCAIREGEGGGVYWPGIAGWLTVIAVIACAVGWVFIF